MAALPLLAARGPRRSCDSMPPEDTRPRRCGLIGLALLARRATARGNPSFGSGVNPPAAAARFNVCSTTALSGTVEPPASPARLYARPDRSNGPGRRHRAPLLRFFPLQRFWAVTPCREMPSSRRSRYGIGVISRSIFTLAYSRGRRLPLRFFDSDLHTARPVRRAKMKVADSGSCIAG
jgi:hypothetical protein